MSDDEAERREGEVRNDSGPAPLPPTESGLGSGLDLGALERLFAPWPVIAEEARFAAEAPAVPPEEAAEVAHAIHRRRVEFATGRACARRALARIGVSGFLLRNDDRRSPRWPPNVVGSLTHTGEVPGGYCAVVVARADRMLTVGVDAEKATELPARLWSFVLTPAEELWMRGLSPARQGLMAKVIFSAKETYYKAQYPITRRWLGFQDVTVVLDVGRETFEVELSSNVSPAALSTASSTVSLGGMPRRCAGRFSYDEELVKTAVAVPRPGISL